MSRYCDLPIAPILDAADRWKQRCLIEGGSIFTDLPVWSPLVFDEIKQLYIDAPDTSSAGYYDKLKGQLANASIQAKWLFVELTWVLYLFPHKLIGVEGKRRNLELICTNVGLTLPANHWALQSDVLSGIGNPGTFFNTGFWFELSYTVLLLREFIKLPSEKREELLNDDAELVSWIDAVPLPNKLETGEALNPNNRQARHILLFLLQPDFHERIASSGHKRRIVGQLAPQAGLTPDITSPTIIDRQLLAIRKYFESKFGTTEIDFYRPPLAGEWKEAVPEPPGEPGSPGSNGHPSSLDLVFKTILERYDNARKTMGFAGNHEIRELFNKARLILRDSPEVKNFPNINVVASYGKGNWATIPWISLLDRRETDTTQAGTYIVYLFEEGGSGMYVKLGQGVTAATNEFGAKAEEVLGERSAEIRSQCMHLAEHGFDLSGQTSLHTEGRLGRLYEASTIAAKHYSRDAMPSETEILTDLNALLQTYDRYVAKRAPGTTPIRDPRPLALIGTWREVRSDAPAIQEKIAQNGGWASWWSFPIKEDALPRLKAPFNVYANIGNGALAARIHVVEYTTSRGNTGIESPWPSITDEEQQGKTRSAENQSLIFKTWFRIDELEILDPPQRISDVDIAPGLSTPENLLSQTTFGYIYDQLSDMSLPEPDPVLPRTPKPELPIEWLIAKTGLRSDILEEMLAALRSSSPQIILSGPPGTGKTWVARALAHYLTRGNEQNIRFVQFHPSYSYESFIEGLRPVSRGGSISFEVTNGLVLSCVSDMKRIGALNDDTQDHVIVIDEANRANLPKVLGELMFLFEYRQQPVRLQYSGDFILPKNLRFIATMNTADRSIRSIDVALRRRFDVFELGPDPEILRKHYENGRASLPGLIDGFIRLNEILEIELDRHHTIGHTFFMREQMNAQDLRQIWNRRVYPLIEEFFFDQPELAKEFSVERFWPATNGR